jgi:hypothetical protein
MYHKGYASSFANRLREQHGDCGSRHGDVIAAFLCKREAFFSTDVNRATLL